MSSHQVSAAAVAVTWSHVSVAEAVLGGMPPRQAFDAAVAAFYYDVGRRLTVRIHPADPPWFTQSLALPESGGAWPQDALAWTTGRKWTTRCFADSAQQNARLLTAGGGLPPHVPAEYGTCDTLAWMAGMMRIYATGGGTLPQAARTALDRRAGRPRQRRAPVDPQWLAGRVGGALDAAWQILRTVPAGCGCAACTRDGALPAARPPLGAFEFAVCACGQLWTDDPAGAETHRAALGHKPERR